MVTLSGITTPVSSVQPKKAEPLTIFTVFGIVTLPEQPSPFSRMAFTMTMGFSAFFASIQAVF